MFSNCDQFEIKMPLKRSHYMFCMLLHYLMKYLVPVWVTGGSGFLHHWATPAVFQEKRLLVQLCMCILVLILTALRHFSNSITLMWISAYINCIYTSILSVRHQEEHRIRKKMSDEVLAFLSVWSKVQIICIWSIWCHCHPVVSCFMKIQIGLTFLVPAYPDCPGRGH